SEPGADRHRGAVSDAAVTVPRTPRSAVQSRARRTLPLKALRSVRGSDSSWFPNSVWERLPSKLCFAKWGESRGLTARRRHLDCSQDFLAVPFLPCRDDLTCHYHHLAWMSHPCRATTDVTPGRKLSARARPGHGGRPTWLLSSGLWVAGLCSLLL